MASDTLASCPFCGWPNISWHVERYAYDWIEYAAYCGNCDAEGKASTSREEAADAWNRRVPAAPASDKVWTPLIDGVNDDICRSLSPEVGVWVYGDGEHISLSTSQYEIFADLPDDIRLCRRTQAGGQDGE